MTELDIWWRLCELERVIHTARIAVSNQDYKTATTLLQGDAQAQLQSIAHDVWRQHHISGTQPT